MLLFGSLCRYSLVVVVIVNNFSARFLLGDGLDAHTSNDGNGGQKRYGQSDNTVV